ncbi:hypothetical protein N0V88_004986 [Collariella sp. IMI 366227]|nr:hypothetical protein N0V88_004986 [Collariella sp. IMI 366227]
MAMRGGPRLQVGSAAWIAEERDSALSIARSEIDEFSFAARNEMDWLNEHMADIFSENQMNVAELFKTPGKLRGKTPRTARKAEQTGPRVPLADVFSADQQGAPSPFATSTLPQPRSPKIRVAEDKPELPPLRQPDPVADHVSALTDTQEDVIFDPTLSSKGTVLSPKPTKDFEVNDQPQDDIEDTDEDDDDLAQSEASSPIRPVRKSSLSFASLPAREPLASKKSLGGARVSRTSHLDFNRQSYFNRHTSGKSLGNTNRPEFSDDDQDEMDVDEDVTLQKGDSQPKAAAHNKTYTQMLQDQISMLGKAQSSGPRPSKSLANVLPSQNGSSGAPNQVKPEPAQEAGNLSSPSQKHSVAGPGAFPEEDDDDWIVPPTKTAPASPKPAPPTAYRSESVEEPAGKAELGSAESPLPQSRPISPAKPFSMLEWTPKHAKSASVPVLPTLEQTQTEDVALKKTISVSNPTLASVAEDGLPSSPSRTPTRSVRENPLRHMKNKLSSLLKNSKGLIASSAAISAEGKSSLLHSPSTARLGFHADPSVDSFRTADTVMYPDLSHQLSAASAPLSPQRERHEAKEREKEEKERERAKKKEMKEAKQLAGQMDKLEKARKKEQEKIAAMEKEVSAKEQQKAARPPPSSQDFRTPGPSRPRSPVKAVRPTPHKPKGQLEQPGKSTIAASGEADVKMADATTAVPPQSIPRPTTSSSMRMQGTKRPLKPAKETLTQLKQVPTLIRVNTTSSQQTNFHPSNSVLGATLQDTLAQPTPSARSVKGKASQPSLQGKPSNPNFGSSVSSTGRPKALDYAAKRKEQEERDAQRRREAKLEADRKRATQEEERRQEQEKEEERKAKKAAIERAKLTKAPPPAARSQPNGPPEYSMADRAAARPPSRLGSTMHPESRLVNTVLAKGPSKRPLQDAGEESSRAKEGKRLRPSDPFEDEMGMMESHNAPIIKGPPVRPSVGFKKVSTSPPILPPQETNPPAQDLPPKSMFNNGYTNAPPSANRNLYKTTITAQHNIKATHPLGMAQLSKGAIPFAPNPQPRRPILLPPQPAQNSARPIGGNGIPKTAKSAARSSPRFQNGESIELPDIQTDDDSEDDDYEKPQVGGSGKGGEMRWTDSPMLRAAARPGEHRPDGGIWPARAVDHGGGV